MPIVRKIRHFPSLNAGRVESYPQTRRAAAKTAAGGIVVVTIL